MRKNMTEAGLRIFLYVLVLVVCTVAQRTDDGQFFKSKSGHREIPVTKVQESSDITPKDDRAQVVSRKRRFSDVGAIMPQQAQDMKAGLEMDTDDPQGIVYSLDELKSMKPGAGVQWRNQMPISGDGKSTDLKKKKKRQAPTDVAERTDEAIPSDQQSQPVPDKTVNKTPIQISDMDELRPMKLLSGQRQLGQHEALDKGQQRFVINRLARREDKHLGIKVSHPKNPVVSPLKQTQNLINPEVKKNSIRSTHRRNGESKKISTRPPNQMTPEVIKSSISLPKYEDPYTWRRHMRDAKDNGDDDDYDEDDDDEDNENTRRWKRQVKVPARPTLTGEPLTPEEKIDRGEAPRASTKAGLRQLIRDVESIAVDDDLMFYAMSSPSLDTSPNQVPELFDQDKVRLKRKVKQRNTVERESGNKNVKAKDSDMKKKEVDHVVEKLKPGVASSKGKWRNVVKLHANRGKELSHYVRSRSARSTVNDDDDDDDDDDDEDDDDDVDNERKKRNVVDRFRLTRNIRQFAATHGSDDRKMTGGSDDMKHNRESAHIKSKPDMTMFFMDEATTVKTNAGDASLVRNEALAGRKSRSVRFSQSDNYDDDDDDEDDDEEGDDKKKKRDVDDEVSPMGFDTDRNDSRGRFVLGEGAKPVAGPGWLKKTKQFPIGNAESLSGDLNISRRQWIRLPRRAKNDNDDDYDNDNKEEDGEDSSDDNADNAGDDERVSESDDGAKGANQEGNSNDDFVEQTYESNASNDQGEVPLITPPQKDIRSSLVKLQEEEDKDMVTMAPTLSPRKKILDSSLRELTAKLDKIEDDLKRKEAIQRARLSKRAVTKRNAKSNPKPLDAIDKVDKIDKTGFNHTDATIPAVGITLTTVETGLQSSEETSLPERDIKVGRLPEWMRKMSEIVSSINGNMADVNAADLSKRSEGKTMAESFESQDNSEKKGLVDIQKRDIKKEFVKKFHLKGKDRPSNNLGSLEVSSRAEPTGANETSAKLPSSASTPVRWTKISGQGKVSNPVNHNGILKERFTSLIHSHIKQLMSREFNKNVTDARAETRSSKFYSSVEEIRRLINWLSSLDKRGNKSGMKNESLSQNGDGTNDKAVGLKQNQKIVKYANKIYGKHNDSVKNSKLKYKDISKTNSISRSTQFSKNGKANRVDSLESAHVFKHPASYLGESLRSHLIGSKRNKMLQHFRFKASKKGRPVTLQKRIPQKIMPHSSLLHKNEEARYDKRFKQNIFRKKQASVQTIPNHNSTDRKKEASNPRLLSETILIEKHDGAVGVDEDKAVVIARIVTGLMVDPGNQNNVTAKSNPNNDQSKLSPTSDQGGHIKNMAHVFKQKETIQQKVKKTRKKKLKSRYILKKAQTIRKKPSSNKEKVITLSKHYLDLDFPHVSYETYANFISDLLKFPLDFETELRIRRETKSRLPVRRDPETHKERALKKQIMQLLRIFPENTAERKSDKRLEQEDAKDIQSSDLASTIIRIDNEDNVPFLDTEDSGDLFAQKHRLKKRSDFDGRASKKLAKSPSLSGQLEKRKVRAKKYVIPYQQVYAEDDLAVRNMLMDNTIAEKNTGSSFDSDVNYFKAMPYLISMDHEVANSAVEFMADNEENYLVTRDSHSPISKLFLFPELGTVNMTSLLITSETDIGQLKSDNEDAQRNDEEIEELDVLHYDEMLRGDRDHHYVYGVRYDVGPDDGSDDDNEDNDTNSLNDDFASVPSWRRRRRSSGNSKLGDDDEEDAGKDDDEYVDKNVDESAVDNDDDEARADFGEYEGELPRNLEEGATDETKNIINYDNLMKVKIQVGNMSKEKAAGAKTPAVFDGNYPLFENNSQQVSDKQPESTDYLDQEVNQEAEDFVDENDNDEDGDEAGDIYQVDTEENNGIEVEDNGKREEPMDEVAYVEEDTLTKISEFYAWGAWGECSVSCGIGQRYRSNRCPDGQPCVGKGASNEVEVCSNGDC